MIDPVLKKDLFDALENLPPTQQRQVVAYAYSLNSVGATKSPEPNWKKAFGILPKEDAEEMLKAVNEGCEKIDSDGW